MTGEEYRETISHLDLTPTTAAQFLGVAETTTRRWVSGRHQVPTSVELLLRVMMKYQLTPDHVMAIAHH
jgi:plasmid maintenance system antidote protein VapI